jgi:hypothetical protein
MFSKLPKWWKDDTDIHKPSTLPEIRLSIGTVKCKYVPQSDITAYEAALIANMITVGLRQPFDTSFQDAFLSIVNNNQLGRHFIPVEGEL